MSNKIELKSVCPVCREVMEFSGSNLVNPKVNIKKFEDQCLAHIQTHTKSFWGPTLAWLLNPYIELESYEDVRCL